MITHSFLDAMHTRFACKTYDTKPLTPDEISFILECGRLSPTSFGFELWEFHAITSEQARNAMFEACFHQESMKTAPLIIAALARTAAAYDPYGPDVKQRAQRFPGTLEEFIDDYKGFHEFLKQAGRLDSWSCSQCYIAIANMMTGAASLGIQSCAIEGFDEQKVLSVLGCDPAIWKVGLIATFGYPAEPKRERIREPLESLTVFH